MPSYDVLNIQNKKVDTVELPESPFGAPVKDHLLWQVVRAQMAKRRRGSASSKDRSEVNYTNAKMFRQKGTGRARMGSRRSGLRVGGGAIFGPRPRDFSMKVPKKVRAQALASAISDKTAKGDLVILDELKMDKIKTRDFAAMLRALDMNNVLFVIEQEDLNVELSSRNINNVKVIRTEGLNVYDILKYRKLAVTKGAIPKIEKRFSK